MRPLALAGEELGVAPGHVVGVDLGPAVDVVESLLSLAVVLNQELPVCRFC